MGAVWHDRGLTWALNRNDANMRSEIAKAAAELKLESGIALVAPHRYKAILDRVLTARTTLGRKGHHSLWWWESLREPVASIAPPDPVAVLGDLVAPKESIWFVVEARGKKEGNFWLYESTIEVVRAILNECPSFEYYVVSKKMDWLICENHHNYLIASGEPMASKVGGLRV